MGKGVKVGEKCKGGKRVRIKGGKREGLKVGKAVKVENVNVKGGTKG